MPASYNDQAILAVDPIFVARVQQAMIAACINVQSEGISNNPNPPGNAIGLQAHLKRAALAVQIRVNPAAFKAIFALGVATDPNVIANATVNGTVVLTTGIIDAQQALISDANIDAAIANQFSGFYPPT
jgi:hypothetical protein